MVQSFAFLEQHNLKPVVFMTLQGRGTTHVLPCPPVASPNVPGTEDINIEGDRNDLNWKLNLA